MTQKMPMSAWPTILGRPLRREVKIGLVFLLCAAPGWLFFDPTAYIARDPLKIYRLHNDDFPYLAASRNVSRAMRNLFVPHNTHIVPAWRLLTWCLSATAGRLSRVPAVLGWASYAVLVAVMLLTGRLVAREVGRADVGLVAMTVVGTNSLMLSPAMWYSAGQTLWAGLGILTTLWYLQGWRRSGKTRCLVLASLAACLAGWFWTVGHFAGPIGAIYLWSDGRRRCRLAAAVPIAASALAVAIGMGLGAGKIDSTVSFHGRTTREAIEPVQGILHTFQAIPENTLLGTVGLTGETTQAQGVALSLMAIAAWLWCRRVGWRFNPLELAGGALLLASYLLEWTVRGYLPFSSLRGIVPWYDAIPQIGAVLFGIGWWSGPRPKGMPPTVKPATRLGGLIALAVAAGLVILNHPRVEAQWRASVPNLQARTGMWFEIDWLEDIRASAMANDRAAWQRRHLAKLDEAQAICRRRGIGRDAIRRIFGRLDAPDLPPVYDAIDLLDIPPRGSETNAKTIVRALAPYLSVEPEPRPPEFPLGDREQPKRR